MPACWQHHLFASGTSYCRLGEGFSPGEEKGRGSSLGNVLQVEDGAPGGSSGGSAW